MITRWSNGKTTFMGVVIAATLLLGFMISTNRIYPQKILTVEKSNYATKAVQSKFMANMRAPARPMTITYRDLSHCERPVYLPEYKAHCWGQCKPEKTCSRPPTAEDISAKRAWLKCFENFYIMGIRKCGTQDITNWFRGRSDMVANKQGEKGKVMGSDYRSTADMCPKDYFGRGFPNNSNLSRTDMLYHDGPGILLMRAVTSQNSTHMEVTPATQLLGFMASPKTKFHIQLRQPTERAISYLYEWKKRGRIYRNVTHEQFDSEFTEYLLLGLLEEMKHCIETYGELGCLYRTQGLDGVMPNLLKHSLYVLYIEEAFKFIPREQIVVTRTEDYAKSEEKVMREVMGVFGVEYPTGNKNTDISVRNQVNKGKKNPVSEKVHKALDSFFHPYNERLAIVLNDEKWLWQ